MSYSVSYGIIQWFSELFNDLLKVGKIKSTAGAYSRSIKFLKIL